MVLHRKIFSPVQKVQKIFSLVLLGSCFMSARSSLAMMGCFPCNLEPSRSALTQKIPSGCWELVRVQVPGEKGIPVINSLKKQAQGNSLLSQYLKTHKGEANPCFEICYVRDSAPRMGGQTSLGHPTLYDEKNIDTIIVSAFDLFGSGAHHASDGPIFKAISRQGFLINGRLIDRECSRLIDAERVQNARGYAVQEIRRELSTIKLPDEWQNRSIEVLIQVVMGETFVDDWQAFNLVRFIEVLKKVYDIEVKYMVDPGEIIGIDLWQSFTDDINYLRRFCCKEMLPIRKKEGGILHCFGF